MTIAKNIRLEAFYGVSLINIYKNIKKNLATTCQAEKNPRKEINSKFLKFISDEMRNEN